MTTPPDRRADAAPDMAPSLPTSRVTAVGSSETAPAEAADGVPTLPMLPAAASTASTPAGSTTEPGSEDSGSSASPFIPAAVRVAPASIEPVDFDAKAMVESQKRFNAKPAYGALPTGTEASREAAEQLRAKAHRVRRRNKRVGWFVGVAFLGGVVAAGWFAYQAYQDEQDQAAIERAENAESDEPGQVDAASPLGQQVEVNDALDDVNSGAGASAGGLLDAVDDARAVVGATDEPATATPAAAIAVDDVLPPIVLEVGQRFPDATGRETYVISADEFAAGDPAAFGEFVRLLSTQPQIGPTAAVFDALPTVAADEIVISIDHDGDELRRAIVWGADSQLYVDYTP